MAKNSLFKTIHLDCPVCHLFHQVEERVRMRSTIIKNEKVYYEEHFYLCTNSSKEASKKENCEFQTEDLISSNLMAARNAYRRGHNLLTSDEIAAVRENYGLTQTEAARLLGWGEATIARYESKAVQDEAYDTMLRILQENPLCAIAFLDKNSDRFTESKKMQIRARMMEKLESYGKEYLTRQILLSEYVKFSVPSDYNGYKMLDIDMLENIVSYYAERTADLYKIRLMNMLWYADVISFKANGNSMTGLVYRHETMGVLPIGQKSLTCLKNINVQQEEEFESTRYHFYPNTALDTSVLSKNETDILDAVITRFRNFSDETMVDYMRGENAYQQTNQGETIPYSLAKKIRG